MSETIPVEPTAKVSLQWLISKLQMAAKGVETVPPATVLMEAAAKEFQGLIRACETLETLKGTAAPSQPVDGNTSDGYHTFNELYAFRLAYNAALFNEWARVGLYEVHKSYRHHEGEPCFGGDWFIVVAMLPEGQISNHYKNEYWDQFQIPAHEKALYPYDGHTSADVLNRLQSTPSQPADPDELARLRWLMAEAKRDFHGKAVLFSSSFLDEAKKGESLLPPHRPRVSEDKRS